MSDSLISPIFHTSSPLNVTINPPDLHAGKPGDGLEVSVLVENLGNQSAVVNVALDGSKAIPHSWCPVPQWRLALGSQQSSEVVFEFNLPSNAVPGTYEYTIVIDAPDHYPEDTPIQYSRQLRVLHKTTTSVGSFDPIFYLKPATNSQNPACLRPGEVLTVEVQVENRTDRVDNFRLVSTDVEADWLTIRYPTPDQNKLGQQIEANSLNLNHRSNTAQNPIFLEVHPPQAALAGLYSITLRLYSENNPNLVLLDLLYLEIAAVDTLSAELQILTDRVRHQPAKYQIALFNQGNVFRQLSFSASCGEEDLCTYDYQPSQLRLSPGREAQVQLDVMPVRRWQRPWWGMGRTIDFQIELQDAQGYQLPTQYLPAKLIWQSRPWWQMALGILLALGLVGGTGVLIWWAFFKPPLPIVVEEFKPASLEYSEGDLVQLSWRIRNPDRIQSLTLTSQIQDAAPDADPIAPKTFNFNDSAPPADLPDQCPEPDLLCQTHQLSKLAAGNYELRLQVQPRSGNSPEPSVLKIPVAAKPDPEVTRLEPTQTEYSAGSSAKFNWTIENVSQLATLTLAAVGQNNERVHLAKYSFAKGIPAELQPLCQRKAETLSCSQVPVSGAKFGAYTFELQGTTIKDKAIQSQPTSTVTIKPRPIRVAFFSVNGQTGGGNIKLNLNQPLTLSWQVEGGEGSVKVNISPYGSFPVSGSANLGRFAAPGTYEIQIVATDEAGQEAAGAGFLVTVVAPPAPTPRPSSLPPANARPLPPLP